MSSKDNIILNIYTIAIIRKLYFEVHKSRRGKTITDLILFSREDNCHGGSRDRRSWQLSESCRSLQIFVFLFSVVVVCVFFLVVFFFLGGGGGRGGGGGTGRGYTDVFKGDIQ